MKGLLNVNEIAEFLKVSRSQVYVLINEGLPVIKVGSNTRFIADDVLEWLKKRNEYNPS